MKLLTTIFSVLVILAAPQGVAFGQAAAACAAPSCLLVPDEKNYTQDEFLLYLSPWSRFHDDRLQRGVDYEDNARVDPATFPNNTAISWRWPTGDLPKGAGVWGYNHIAFGNFSGGIPQLAVAPSRVTDILELKESFNVSFEDSENFNLLTETFLTAGAGDQDKRVIEIGFFLHAPAVSSKWLRSSTVIGTFEDSEEFSWTVQRSGNFVTFLPADGTNVLTGTVDFKAAFEFLIGQKVIVGDEWFNGLAFGIEPTLGGGSGTLRIHELNVAYQ